MIKSWPTTTQLDPATLACASVLSPDWALFSLFTCARDPFLDQVQRRSRATDGARTGPRSLSQFQQKTTRVNARFSRVLKRRLFRTCFGSEADFTAATAGPN